MHFVTLTLSHRLSVASLHFQYSSSVTLSKCLNNANAEWTPSVIRFLQTCHPLQRYMLEFPHGWWVIPGKTHHTWSERAHAKRIEMQNSASIICDMKPWHYKHLWHMLRHRTGIPFATFKSVHHSVSPSACTEGRFVVFLGQDLAYVTLPMTDWFDLLVVCVDAARWFSNPPDLRHNTSCSMNTSREPGWTMFKTSDPTRCCFLCGFTSEVLKWSTKLVFFFQRTPEQPESHLQEWWGPWGWLVCTHRLCVSLLTLNNVTQLIGNSSVVSISSAPPPH